MSGLSRRAALAVGAGLGAAPASAALDPDRDLIAAALEFLDANAAVSAVCKLHDIDDDDPAWLRFEAAERRLRELGAAQSLHGVVAKALVARAFARRSSAGYSYEDSLASDFAGEVVDDLLRLAARVDGR